MSAPTSNLLRVRVSMVPHVPSLARLTPGSAMRWGRCEFALNPTEDRDWDFWIIWGNAWPRESARVARANTLFVAGEPPAKKVYAPTFYRQFAHVVDTHDASRHPGLVMDALGLPWLAGFDYASGRYGLGYDELRAMQPPLSKENRVSVICSATAQTAGQRDRLRFLAALKERLGDLLVHYGKGFRPVSDKLEAILPYRFSLVLENSHSPHYWSEKLADAYLGWSFPFYSGAPNVGDYFAADSFASLPANVAEAAASIQARLENKPDEIVAVTAAREAVLEKYNPFARFDHWVRRFHHDAPRELVTIRSAKAYRPVRGWFYRLQHG